MKKRTASASTGRAHSSGVGQSARRRRSTSSIAAVFALLASVFFTVSPAAAEYHDFADNTAWTTDSGDVFAIWRTGDRIFVGGSFTGVKDGVNGTPVSQAYLAAFDADSGAHIPSFDPILNGSVRTIASSSDGARIFAGGDFTQVDGLTRQRLVAIDANTGVVDPNFVSDANNEVHDIEVWGDDVYVGGRFTSIGGRFGGRAARIDAATGDRDRTWAPRPDALVAALSIPPSGGRIYVGGTFDALDGVATDPMVAVDMVTGARLPAFDTTFSQRVYEIESTDDRVYIAHGDFPNIASMHTSDGTELASYNGDGDYQAVVLDGDRVFVGSHSSHFGGLDRDRLATVNVDDGSFNASFNTPVFAPEGIWAIYPSGRHLWIGGDIVRVNGQLWEGLARLTPAPTETIPSTPTLTASTLPGRVDLSWSASTDDGTVDGYRVLRAGRQIAYISGTSFSDLSVTSGVGYEYAVEAIDDDYNVSDRSASAIITAASDTTDPSETTGLAVTGLTDFTVSLGWNDATDNVAVTDYRIYRDGSSIGTSTTTSFIDSGLTTGTEYVYTVAALDAAGNLGPQSDFVIGRPVPGGTNNFTSVSYGSAWSYLDDGSNQGTAWQALTFDDSGWSSGDAQLGYGDGDENTTVSFGPDSGNKYRTTYFRREFTPPAGVTSLQLSVVRDDGVAVHLNGSEVVRDNLSAGYDYLTLADSAIGGSGETTPQVFSIDPASLATGTNVIAVEIHQANGSSSDISFDLELTGVSVVPNDAAPSAPSAVALVGSTQSSIDLSWTGSTDDNAVASYRIYRDGVAVGTVAHPATTYTDSGLAATTSYEYVIVALDNAGNPSAPSTPVDLSTSAGDSVDPETVVDVPAAQNQVFATTTVDLSGTATDDVGVTAVNIAIRDRINLLWLQDDLVTWATAYNNFPATLTAPDTTATAWNAPTLTLPEGNYAIQARATDAAGNRDETPPYVRFTVETTPADVVDPETVVDVPAAQNQVFATTTVDLSGTATDDVGVTAVNIAIRDRINLLWLQDDLVTWATAYNNFPATLTAPDTTATAWNAPTLTLPEGNYAIQARATDAASNRDETPPFIRFLVDTTP